jgi:hypothetical protein
MIVFRSGSEDSMFQKLLFLVRDFQWTRDFPFGYSDDTTQENPNFMKSRLLPNPRFGVEQNYIREQIRSAFPHVAAYLLPYPGNDLAVHDRLNNLDQDFASSFSDFVETTFSSQNLIPKRIGNVQMTGSAFKPHVNAWIRLFDGQSSNGLPQVHSIHDTTANLQHVLALKDALTYYDAEMRKAIYSTGNGMENEGSLLNIHSRLADNAFKVFKSVKKIGGKGFEDNFNAELGKSLEALYGKYAKVNYELRVAADNRRRFEESKKQMEDEILQSNVRFPFEFPNVFTNPFSEIV